MHRRESAPPHAPADRFSGEELKFMRLALRLANRGKGRTSPNPAVGAVVVRGRRVIGRGWHRRSGEAHAEVRAIAQAGGAARGATMYVTLEPCCTYGRTPPCTDAIVHAGLKKVIVATLDPNPRHHGRGIALLRRRGVLVRVGALSREASALNEDFAKYIKTGLPFTTVKVAMSIDGKIATVGGDSRWISGAESRRQSHRIRFCSDAVLVGRRTVERDNPSLTARPGGRVAKVPWRIILDSKAEIPFGSNVLKPPDVSKTVIAVTGRAPRGRIARLEALGARVIRCPTRRGRVSLRSLWRRLGRMGVMSVMVEGGGETIASALEAGVVDSVMIFIAPAIIGGRGAPTPVGGAGIKRIADAIPLSSVAVARCGDDILIEGRVNCGRKWKAKTK
ncbi:MAG: bifunctional diaminohydroxyphosphoribosylaminopyrimidine deaminase/5-amino-6-(5-phosphoribosylamino)uracil reductase RibD [Candidatus Aureabacteria bacterium]|nr:bifunctional diaminohydroxyphosphoribosylaminopyrimidine deaminase/5-amino-6-(5-phosphoribosylamino)uracil reductase RibD [Candidatus Auribacterota bacterium]